MTIPPDFPWRRSMTVLLDGKRFLVLGVTVHGDKLVVVNKLGQERVWWAADCTPDPNDGATLGALEQAVGEAYPEWGVVFTMYRGSAQEWHVVGRHKDYARRHDHETLGAGLSRRDALLAAWNARPRPA